MRTVADRKAGPQIGEVVAFRACSRFLRSGALAVVSRTDGNTIVERLDGLCPAHETTACLETYYAAGHLSRWTWRGWLKWWRGRKAARR